MSWNIDKNRPICPQIYEYICVMISNGEFGPGEKLLSVRDVAVKAGVNPNTVQKSFEQLENLGVIYSVRGTGWFVGDNTDVAKQTVDRLKKEKSKAYFSDMMSLGMSYDEIKKYVEEMTE